MKYAFVVALAVLAGTGVAEAKGGKQVFNAPSAYDYSRERKADYKRDYCEDAVGNHLYCQGGAQAGPRNGRYTSRYPAN